ncbi:MAG TPA: CAP domain-containing protein [Vicinamibacterales bacterium]|nr:CAP domain-containing protein [Vicinamibacterales bacterium]
MSLGAIILVTLGLTTGFVGGDADSVTGRCRDGRVWTTSPAEQGQMLGLLNRVRAEAARPPLRRQAVLDRMALAHAVDMACRDYFDHRNPERMRLQDRLKRVNDGSLPAWHRLAEVIGTSATPGRQLERWLGSRSHRRAVLEEEHDLVGVGLVRIAGSRYDTYWAVEFVAAGR